MTVVAWYELVVGGSIVGFWVLALVTRRVPEIAEGRRDIRFHIAAELLAAVGLIVGGVWLLTGRGRGAELTSALALGALVYTTVNSPGYYADRGDRAAVGAFAVLTVAALLAAGRLLAGS